MACYHFQCTNGLECVFDAIGNDIRLPEQLPRPAEQVAQSVMRSSDDYEDWSQWHVSVHDLSGRRVLVQPFTAHTGELSQAA